MFDSGRNVLIFSIVLAFVIIGSIVEGYILYEQVTMTLDNWQGIITFRLLLHLIGIFPLLYLIGKLTETLWKPVVTGILLLAAMNYNPILDLVYGPIVIEHIEPQEWVREEFANPSSDVDFSTREVPMIRLEQNGRAIMLTKERWEGMISNCNGEMPLRFVGLEYLEVELEWGCPQ